MRRPFIAGNWKMNTSRSEAHALAREVALNVGHKHCDVAVCVPFPHLQTVADATRGGWLRVGAQDVHWEPKGAYTGEVSVSMLEEYCRYVIIGHSERRQYFCETDEIVNRKLVAVLDSHLDPIVCIGEQLEDRTNGRAEEVLGRQIREGLKGISLNDRITIAYEPIWAIGTGETATPEIAQETCAFIRSQLRALDSEAADRIRIQYGGSVTPANAAELLAQPDIDGALVGGAALKASSFLAIVEAAARP